MNAATRYRARLAVIAVCHRTTLQCRLSRLLGVLYRFLCFSLILGALAATSPPAAADLFGSGENRFSITFVPIGDPGNPGEPTQFGDNVGAVPYAYRIGEFEISEQMIHKANASGNLEIEIPTRGPDKPATEVDWFEAARFVNWLNTSTGNPPAYKFDAAGDFQLWEPSDPGYDPENLYRSTLAKYFLPSVDEWHKAAYYEAASGTWFDYPTGSDQKPISVPSGTDPGTAVYGQPFEVGPADVTQAGGLSPYGTMAQGGNVWEWEETATSLRNISTLGSRGVRGGTWVLPARDMLADRGRLSLGPADVGSGELVGFRVASVIPEPSTGATAIAGLLVGLAIRTRFPNRTCSRFPESRGA